VPEQKRVFCCIATQQKVVNDLLPIFQTQESSSSRIRLAESMAHIYEEIDPDLVAELETGNKSSAVGGRSTPSIWDSLSELPRTLLEMSALSATWPLLSSAPRGDGHSVFVMPGFMAGDRSTLALRRFLDRQNLNSISWELGQNNGSFDQQDELLRRFEQVMASTSGAISLVGQSLGGVYARLLANHWPERIRQVITLGSPFASPGPDTVNATVSRLFQYMSGMSEDEMRDQMLGLSSPLRVPATAIFSRSDGVVHWTSCIDGPGHRSENVEILGSHSGMGFNPTVLYVIADRLAQAADNWRPFNRRGCLKGLVFPASTTQTRLS
jgi:pimeloyl-ACP methyl ester carboxylesterase